MAIFEGRQLARVAVLRLFDTLCRGSLEIRIIFESDTDTTGCAATDDTTVDHILESVPLWSWLVPADTSWLSVLGEIICWLAWFVSRWTLLEVFRICRFSRGGFLLDENDHRSSFRLLVVSCS